MESGPEKITYVDLGAILRERYGLQVQYLVRYFDRQTAGDEYLGEGLHITGDAGNYHSMKVDQNDLPEVLTRMDEVMLKRNVMPKDVIDKVSRSSEKKDTDSGEPPFMPDWAKK